MKNYNDRCSDVLSCVLQHGSLEPQNIVHLIELEKGVIFKGVWSFIYKVIINYFRLTESIIGLEEFVDLIESAQTISQEQRLEYEELFASLLARPVKADSFRFYCRQLVEDIMQSRSSNMLDEAKRALNGKVSTELETLAGYEKMRRVLLKGMFDLDRLVSESTFDGNVRDEMSDVLKEYANLGKQKGVVSTGFSVIDKKIGGLYPGELWLLVGYAGDGKTFSCVNIGHNAAFVEGKNVVFFTSETIRSVVRRRLIARHAKDLNNIGIDLTAWKKGALTPEADELMRETLADMADQKKEYGVFELVQLPANATTDYIAAALSQYQVRFEIDLCILDSIHLLKPKKNRQYAYAELDDMLVDLKKIIVTHNNGKGVPFISPWHSNRQGWKEARENGIYTKSALAKSSEAERQADVILAILRQDISPEELRGSILKNRDGEEMPEFYLKYDFNKGYIGDNPDMVGETIDLMAGLGLN
jgi:replicative DNA helicase